MKNPPYEILIVEDNLAHLKLTQYILHKNKVESKITVVRDGQAALDYLFKKKEDMGEIKLTRLEMFFLR
mgnify:CR=1 FL=1